MTKREIAEEIDKVRRVYQKARAALYREERGQLMELQDQCGELGHDWKLHPTPGEGQYCETCGIRSMDKEDSYVPLHRH